jgi:hypothetical protein
MKSTYDLRLSVSVAVVSMRFVVLNCDSVRFVRYRRPWSASRAAAKLRLDIDFGLC